VIVKYKIGSTKQFIKFRIQKTRGLGKIRYKTLLKLENGLKWLKIGQKYY